MNKLIKLFPLMPAPKDGTNLALALAFYILMPLVAIAFVAVVLGLTIIFALLIPVAALLLVAYSVMGIIFSIMSYNGHSFTDKSDSQQ